MPASILVADDEKGMLNLYSKLFSRTEYSVTMASSFSEAAALISSNSYDLLVTDLAFPDGLGTELVKMFENRRAGARSVVVTGSSPSLARTGNNPGTIYFEKPFKVEAFLAAVSAALSA